MKRNAIVVSLAASLFVLANAAHADRSGVLQLASATEASMEEGVRSGAVRGGLENPHAIESVFPTQGPDDK
jgi:hypothetical protein